jgi:hypothetical protein
MSVSSCIPPTTANGELLAPVFKIGCHEITVHACICSGDSGMLCTATHAVQIRTMEISC